MSADIDEYVKIAGVLGSLATIIMGIVSYVYTAKQQLAREERESLRETQIRKVEATKPFLERQLTLYTEVSKVAASLATTTDQDEKITMRRRFLQLYWGELALVENPDVESAMVQFKNCMEEGSPDELAHKSLALAHACRDSLAVSWGVEQWRKSER